MTEEQAKFILFKASAAYPNQIELEDEIIAVWVERLWNISFEIAVNNLNRHIDTCRYFPTIADVSNLEQAKSPYTNYKQQVLEHMLYLEDTQSKAVKMPEHLRKLVEDYE